MLCREEAMVYVENYLRGERDPEDMAALADFLELVPAEDRCTFPFDVPALTNRLRADLVEIRSRQSQGAVRETRPW